MPKQSKPIRSDKPNAIDTIAASMSPDAFRNILREAVIKHPEEKTDGMSPKELMEFAEQHPDLLFRAVVCGFWLGYMHMKAVIEDPIGEAEIEAALMGKSLVPTASADTKRETDRMFQ